MAPGQNYTRTPIIEAIIDLRIEPPDHLPLEILERCQAGEETAYPTKKTLKMAQLSLGGAGGSFSQTASTEPIGFTFKSIDDKRIFQARRDGFSMHQLAPYPGWEAFRNEARRLWTIYQERIRPLKVIRLAVRFINRLDLPGSEVDLKDYLKTSPEVSPELSQPLASFLMQFVVPQKDMGGMLRLTETSVAPVDPSTTAIALDIDLSRQQDMPTDEEEIWAFFEELRRRKNAIFEACITDKTRELLR